MIVDIWVPGHPRPQGSKTPITRGGRTWLIEKSKYLEEWRRAVALSTRAAGAALGDAPVGARIVFYLPRPADHYGTGRNAGVLKPGAPAFPMGKAGPDADKLERAVFDGLAEGGAYGNDSQVVVHASAKLYASAPRGPGCMITLMDVSQMAATLRHARVDADLWDAAVAATGDSGISEAKLLRAGLYALTMLPPDDKLRCMERAQRQAGWPRTTEGT